MIDAHCHLNFHAFEKDRREVIKKALASGVNKIINVGTKIDSSIQAVALAKEYPQLYAIIGVHPHHADKLDTDWLKQLEVLSKNKKVVAIGECGMDYFHYQSNGIVDKTVQKDVFIKQIGLSKRLNLPLQIHNRHAGKDILDILSAYKKDLMDIPGMFHCFSGDIEFLKKVLDLGFYVGFDGNITYKGFAPGENVSSVDLVKYAPLDRIITETDSPYLTPEPHRGSRNTPYYVIMVAQFIVKIKGVSEEAVEQQTTKNACFVFNLK